MKPELVLASGSPRRRELLSLITPDFIVDKSNAEDKACLPEDLSPQDTPAYLCSLKARDVASRHPGALIIASDTAVFLPSKASAKADALADALADARPDGPDAPDLGKDARKAKGLLLGKPKDRQDAARMLELLSGRAHQVITSVHLICGQKERAFTQTTEVEFYPLNRQDIDWYISTNEPMDKAGAYGIQGYGALLVKGLSGDYYTVMGLPVARLYREMKDLTGLERFD